MHRPALAFDLPSPILVLNASVGLLFSCRHRGMDLEDEAPEPLSANLWVSLSECLSDKKYPEIIFVSARGIR